ncbi:MAG: hypothetical protein ACR2I0_13010 [Rhodoferax sp.]
MKNTSTLRIALITFVATVALVCGAAWLVQNMGLAGPDSATGQTPEQILNAAKGKYSTENANFVCEVMVSMPQGDLEADPKVYTDVVVVGLNFEQKAGWYQGQFSISESRKGTMVIEGSKVVVSRPAMFSRFGQMVIGEDFTFDRADGAFVQTLTFKGGKRRHIIKGTCAKMTSAPF